MKRILSILCVLAMLLSLPIAPGIVASAEVATAKPSELVNLWTAENRSWGLHQNGKADYDTNYGKKNTSRSNPGHNSSEFIEAKKGDIFYFGPCADQSVYAAYKTTAQLSTNTFTWAAKGDNIIVDTFDNGWTIRSFTMPCDGAIAITNNNDVGDAFNLFTKNQAFDCKGYFDHYNNNVYLFNSNGKRLNDTAAEVEDANYNTTTYIKVTPGETLTMGPVTSDQAYFGYAYDASKTALAPITKAMLTKVDDFGYTIGYYAHMGSGQAGPNKGMSYVIDETAVFYSCVVPEGVGYIRVTFDNSVRAKAMVVRGTMDMAAYQAIEGIDANNPLTGKTALFVGDSVTHATRDYKWAEEGINYRGWAGRIADANDMIVYNYGRTSSSLSTSRTGDEKTGTIINQLNNALTAGVDYDYVVLGGGVNDMWDNVAVGTLTAADVKTGFDQTTYAGALEATIAKAIELYGNATISYIIHPKVLEYSVASLNDTAYAAACAEVARAACAKWGINCIDLLTNETVLNEFCTVIRFNGTDGVIKVVKGTDDNLHPNAMGYELLAPIIAEGMKKATVAADIPAYEPIPLSEANLWTLETRNWGVRYGTGTQYWNAGRKNPGHNSSDWIDVKKGDQIYIGAAYYSQAHINWAPQGTALTASGLVNYDNSDILWLDEFTNGTFKIGVWTAPNDGKASILNKQNAGNDDFFIFTKNRPFSMAEYLDYYQNNVYLINDIGKYIDGAGAEAADTNYFTTEYIKVTPGETLTLAPVVTGKQAYFGYAYSAAKNPVKPITLGDLTYKDSFDYAMGYYSSYANSNGRSNTYLSNTPDKYQYYLSKGADLYTYTVPENVEYIRVTFMTAAKSKAVVLRGDVGMDGYYAVNGIEADNPLIGKTALFIGDSITEAAADYSKEGVKSRGWAGRIADKYDMLVENMGVSGAALTTRKGIAQMIIDQLNTVRYNDYDYVMIHGGVNDIWDNPVAKGTVKADQWDNFDTSTFAGGMEATIAKAVELFGDTATIGYIWNYQIKDSKWATACDKGQAAEFYDTVVAVCEKWNIEFVDLYNDERVTKGNFFDKSTFTKDNEYGGKNETVNYDGTYDNVHCNALGLDILAPIIGEFMETKLTTPVGADAPTKEDRENTVIALIGDDLTKGTGTTDRLRKSYAALLQDMLGDSYDVMNYGLTNGTAQQDTAGSYLKNDIYAVSKNVKADKLVVMLGTNDAKTAIDLTSKDKFKEEYTYLVEQIKAEQPDAEIYLATNPAVTDTTLTTVMEAGLNAAIQEVATALNLKFIDVYAATKANKAAYVAADGILYSDAGHAALADIMLEALDLEATQKTAPVVDTTAEYTGTYPGVPTVSQYVADEKYQSYDAYRIVNEDDWKVFGDLVASGVTFAEKTVYLENDLDLAGKRSIRPVGTGVPTGDLNENGHSDEIYRSKIFAGTLEGNGHTIHVAFEYFSGSIALFTGLKDATIQNLNVTGSVYATDLASGIAPYAYNTTIQNVVVSADVTNYGICVGGAAGVVANAMSGGKLINVGYTGTVTASRAACGLVAYSSGVEEVKNCFFAGASNAGLRDTYSQALVRKAAASVHTNNYVAEGSSPGNKEEGVVETVISAESFTDGTFVVQMNGGEGKWTVKDGKIAIADEDDLAPIPVTLDGKDYLTNNEGKVLGEVKTETGYFLINNELVTDAEMAERSFTEANTTLTSVAKLAGDATGDASFNLVDITTVMSYLVDEPIRVVELNADYSGNGKVNVADVVRMLQAQATIE